MSRNRLAGGHSARAWNQKNFPSRKGPLQEQQLSEVARQVPSAAIGWLRRYPGVLALSLLAISVMGLVLALSRRD